MTERVRRLRVHRAREARATDVAAASRATLDAPLCPGEARLLLAIAADEAIALGSFQRARDVARGDVALVRRGSGGAAARLGPGRLTVQLTLPTSAALTACAPAQLLNRYVRPLLRALAGAGARASYFGRDWVSVAHRPAALVALGHDATTGRAAFEAIVGLRAPFDVGPRASFLDKAPGTVEELAGRAVDEGRLLDALADGYASAFDLERVDDDGPPPGVDGDVDPGEPPWRATRAAAIGTIGAGPDAHGALRLGGELLASRDAIARLAARAAALPGDAPRPALEALAAEELGHPDVVVLGVTALEPVVAVLAEARAAT